MKPVSAASVLVLAGWLTGCASAHHEVVLQPVGPPPGASEAASSEGSLVVYSAQNSAPDFNQSPYRRSYTDYEVLSADGTTVVRKVHNDTGKMVEGPARVSLPVGSYRVVARANGYGTVTVPVVIKGNQVTTVHLEGSVWWPARSPIHESNPVRLPHGEIAGWRADDLAK